MRASTWNVFQYGTAMPFGGLDTELSEDMMSAIVQMLSTHVEAGKFFECNLIFKFWQNHFGFHLDAIYKVVHQGILLKHFV